MDFPCAGRPAVSTQPGRPSPHQHFASYVQRGLALPAFVARHPTFRRELPRGFSFRHASVERGICGMDFRAEECSQYDVLPAHSRCLRLVCREAWLETLPSEI